MATKGQKKLNSIHSDEHDLVEYRKRVTTAVDGDPVGYEDTSFISGDSPAVLDIYTDLEERIGHTGYIVNDGPGSMKIQFSRDGSSYGSELTLEGGETMNFSDLKIKKIKFTHVDNTAYRTMVA